MLLAALIILGLILGSFLNVLIVRLPANQPIGGRSHCQNCGAVLRAVDLVPLFSYFYLRGKCKFCGSAISPRYILVEAATAILLAVAYLLYFSGQAQNANWLDFSRIVFIILVCIVVFAIDYEHFLILDSVVLPASAVLLLLNVFSDYFAGRQLGNSLSFLGLFSAASASLIFWGIHYFSAGKWMGFGDAKFVLFLGLATPYPLILLNLFLAFAIGSVVGSALIIMKRKNFKSQMPFGTFLAVSTVITLFLGTKIINWYLATVVGGY